MYSTLGLLYCAPMMLSVSDLSTSSSNEVTLKNHLCFDEKGVINCREDEYSSYVFQTPTNNLWMLWPKHEPYLDLFSLKNARNVNVNQQVTMIDALETFRKRVQVQEDSRLTQLRMIQSECIMPTIPLMPSWLVRGTTLDEMIADNHWTPLGLSLIDTVLDEPEASTELLMNFSEHYLKGISGWSWETIRKFIPAWEGYQDREYCRVPAFLSEKYRWETCCFRVRWVRDPYSFWLNNDWCDWTIFESETSDLTSCYFQLDKDDSNYFLVIDRWGDPEDTILNLKDRGTLYQRLLEAYSSFNKAEASTAILSKNSRLTLSTDREQILENLMKVSDEKKFLTYLKKVQVSNICHLTDFVLQDLRKDEVPPTLNEKILLKFRLSLIRQLFKNER